MNFIRQIEVGTNSMLGQTSSLLSDFHVFSCDSNSHCLDPEQYFVKRRSNLDGPSSNYIWFGEKQILYTDHWIISDLDVYSTDVSSILRLEKESAAIYVTMLTRIQKWKLWTEAGPSRLLLRVTLRSSSR